VLLNSANMSAMLLYIITNAVLFSFIMTNENIPQALADWMLGHGLGVIAFLLAVNVCCCWPATSWSRRPSC
jgi:C4-dicarboxylate transporter DctM subunit